MGHKRSSKKSEIVVNRQGDKHKQQCDKGYCKSGIGAAKEISGSFTQIHHVICISSMSKATIKDKVSDAGKMEFIRECLKLTKWNINDSPNTVGLPKKQAFVHQSAPGGWDGWPCHQVEHPPYTDKVSSQLNTNVWQQVLKNRKKCAQCKTECNINAASVKTQLEGESKHWLKFLGDRGSGRDQNPTSPQGTAFCWTNRLSIPNTWYIPFSMNPNGATPRKPPPQWTSGTLKNYCSKVMFSMI
jgi:NADH:ubiquinone oxidoreductase subunit